MAAMPATRLAFHQTSYVANHQIARENKVAKDKVRNNNVFPEKLPMLHKL
jgi:hypothetical protein